MNSINVIRPYRWEGLWVFDDPAKGLDKEPFIEGMPEIIEYGCSRKGIEKPERGFTVYFSAQRMPGVDYVLKLVGPEESGHIYELEGTEMQGWLCPALMKYFDEPPEHIYIKLAK